MTNKVSLAIGSLFGLGMLPVIYFSVRDYVTQFQLTLLFSGIALAIPTGIFLGINGGKWSWFRQLSSFLSKWQWVIFLLIITGIIILQLI